MKRRVWSLGAKLVAMFALAAALPAAVEALLLLRDAREQVRRDAFALLQARASELAGRLDGFNEGYLNLSRRLADSPSMARHLAPGAPPPTAEEVASLAAAFRSDPHVRGVGLLDDTGRTILATEAPLRGRSYAFRGYFQDAMKGEAVVSDLYVAVPEVGSVPSIAYAAPVRHDANQALGVAVIWVRAQAVWDVMQDAGGQAGAGSYAALLDRHGVRMAHSAAPELVFTPAGPLDPGTVERLVAERRFGARTRELLERPRAAGAIFELARSGDEIRGPVHTASATNDVDNVGAGQRLRTAAWTVFYLVPQEVVDASATALLSRATAVSAVVLGLALLGAVAFARRVAQPISRLARAADAVAHGEAGVRVPVDRDDELGRLAERFNAMAESIGITQSDLRESVRLQTEAFERANRELEARNRTLGERTAELGRRQEADAAYGRILDALAGTEAVEVTLKHALAIAAPRVHAVVLFCYRLAGEGTTLEPVAAWGAAGPVPAVPLEGIPREVLERREAMAIDAVPPDLELRFETALAAGRPRSVLFVPLVAPDRPLGLIVAGGLAPFPAEALQFLASLAVPFALALARHELLQRTRLYADELSRRNQELVAQAEELRAQAAELAAQQEQLLAKNRQVEEANRAKSSFLANMSHELRTPLNAVIGFSDIVAQDAADRLTRDEERYLREVSAAGRHLLGLINELLDLSKIEAGRLEMAPEEVAAGNAVQEAASAVAPAARERGVTLVTHAAAARAVRADRRRLHQVLLNLLSNAVKFSPAGGAVTVGAEDEGPFVRFTVRDQGPGISADLMARLFSPFVQGDSSLVRTHQGTGLGLAISKKLVEAQGGEIAVDSVPGEGAAFSFTVPAVTDAPRPASPGRAIGGRSDLILIVEARAEAAHLVTGRLEGAGYATEVCSPADAVARAEALRPAAILLDVNTPDEDGLSLVRALRASPATQEVPVLLEAVSADGLHGAAMPALDYLPKPIDPSHLLRRMRELLGNGARQPPPWILLVEDDPRAARLVGAMLEREGYAVGVATTGSAGLAMARERVPDLAIVDIGLPDISGFEVVEGLAGHPSTSACPILVLTAMDLSEGDQQRLRRHALALAEKGDLSAEALLAVVDRAVGRARPSAAAAGLHVLVVDDHDVNRALVRALLERRGCAVAEASDGSEGLQRALAERPDLVLMDLAMPVMDGLAAVRRMKDAEGTGAIPVVALTAHAMQGDEERARAAGFDDYLTKPVDQRALDRVLASAARAKTARASRPPDRPR